MEIISYVLEGAFQHKDSMGNGSVIKPGDIQRMSAGTGVAHSEMNPSPNEPFHFLQIWIQPRERGLTPPGYEEKRFPPRDAARRASPHRGARRTCGAPSLFTRTPISGPPCSSPASPCVTSSTPGRHAWLHVAAGAISANGRALRAGDGAAISDEKAVEVTASDRSEVLLFDLN